MSIVASRFSRGLNWNATFAYLSQKRNNVTLAQVNSQSIVTKAFLDARQPRNIRKLKAFHGVPPTDLTSHFFEKLNGCYGNPRSIMRAYVEYQAITDHPDLNWLIRCFCQLGNAFGFNSFWSTKDRQLIQSTTKFKEMVFDIIEKKHEIHYRKAPRILYAMAALEYRSHLLFEPVVEMIDTHLNEYKPGALANASVSLALLGFGGGNDKDQNQIGNLEENSKNYSDLVKKIICRVLELEPSAKKELLPADWAGMAYALTVFGDYELLDGKALPKLLRNACEAAGNDLKKAGWARYWMYQTLYCTDVEKPANEIFIKKAVPLSVQQQLHTDWLDEIVLHAQPQGSENLQKDFDECLSKLRVRDALINCSAGRAFDEQHCWFTGHLIKSRDLALEYDHLHPLGLDRPRASGHVQLKTRILKHLGLNVATVHKCFWDQLEPAQKDLMAARIIAAFPLLRKPEVIEKPGFAEDRNLKRTAKSVPEKWPIEMYVKY